MKAMLLFLFMSWKCIIPRILRFLLFYLFSCPTIAAPSQLPGRLYGLSAPGTLQRKRKPCPREASKKDLLGCLSGGPPVQWTKQTQQAAGVGAVEAIVKTPEWPLAPPISRMLSCARVEIHVGEGDFRVVEIGDHIRAAEEDISAWCNPDDAGCP